MPRSKCQSLAKVESDDNCVGTCFRLCSQDSMKNKNYFKPMLKGFGITFIVHEMHPQKQVCNI